MDRVVLRRLRKDRDLSLKALGNLVGLSATTLSDWEHGKVTYPDREKLEAVDAVLGAGGQVLAESGFTPQGSVDMAAMVAALTDQVRQLQALVAIQARRLAALERRIVTLEQ